MDKIIEAMRTQEALAAWEAAGRILNHYHGDTEIAVLHTMLAVGHGLTRADADHLVYLIRSIAKEG